MELSGSAKLEAARAFNALRRQGFEMDACQGEYFHTGFANGYLAAPLPDPVRVAKEGMKTISTYDSYRIANHSAQSNIVHYRDFYGTLLYADLPDGEWYGEQSYMLGVAAGIAAYRKEQACLQTTRSGN